MGSIHNHNHLLTNQIHDFLISVSMRYGGCISKYYANQFTCKKLFSNDSNFNPSTLLNVVTDFDDFVESLVEDFRRNATKYLPQLFSNGTGRMNGFVEGLFTLTETIGFNMEKMRTLKQPIIIYLSAILTTPAQIIKPSFLEVRKKMDDLLKAIENLDTNQDVSPDKLYSFVTGLTGSKRVEDQIKAWKFRLAVENIPRMLRSMIPADNDQALQWFDRIVNALSKINLRNHTQSAVDFANEVTASVTMPAYAKQTITYVANGLFECAGDVRLRRPFYYLAAKQPCIDALLKYAEPDTYTVALTSTVTKLTLKIFQNKIPKQFVETISNSLQTLFRTFCPIPTSEMHAAYQTFIDQSGSVMDNNFRPSARLGETNMSEVLVGYIRRVNPTISTSDETVIINLSKTFYNIMSSKCSHELETLMALISGFDQFPQVNSRKILKVLQENYGQRTHDVLRPFIDNLQTLIDSFITRHISIGGSELTSALRNLTTAYQAAFPTSKFPPIATRYVKYIEKALFIMIYGLDYSPCRKTDPSYAECIEAVTMKHKFNFFDNHKELTSIETDLFFAILETTGFTSDSYIQEALVKNQTALAVYARLLKSLNLDDVKELQNDYDMWFMNIFRASDNYKFDNFILAINYTTDKIITKLTNVMKDLRYVHAPE